MRAGRWGRALPGVCMCAERAVRVASAHVLDSCPTPPRTRTRAPPTSSPTSASSRRRAFLLLPSSVASADTSRPAASAACV